MGYEDISGRRMITHDVTATMPAAASGTPLQSTLWHTLVSLTIEKIVGVASGNTAGATASLAVLVNGVRKGVAVATLTAAGGTKIFTYNFPTSGGATSPADAWIGYAVRRAAATAAANTRLISYYAHGHKR